MLVRCGALACRSNSNGMCQADSIQIVDIEEKENIKLKDEDFAVCKSFEMEE